MRTAWMVACLAIMTIGSIGPVSAAPLPGTEPMPIVADLEGQPIERSTIPTYFCHDLDFPKIRCFRTARQLERAEADRRVASSQAAAFGPSDYVSIYDGQNTTGSFMDLSQNYDTLFGIGWNDRISSYKGRNSASGTFWTDWFASGTARNFCCNTIVNSLPAGLDNAFTSVYRH